MSNQNQGRAIMRGVFAACERRKRKQQREAFSGSLPKLSEAIETAMRGWGRHVRATAVTFRQLVSIGGQMPRRQLIRLLEQRVQEATT